MADLDIGAGDRTGFVDNRFNRGLTGATVLAEEANYSSISSMKARLTALNSTSYSTARLATMTQNDMVYALRVASADAAGIK